MDKELKELKDYYQEQYDYDSTERIKNQVFSKISQKDTKPSIGRRVVYITSSAALFIGLLFGSAFIFPPIANVLAQIPILNIFFDKNIHEIIDDSLEKKGYNASVSFLHVKEKTVDLVVTGSEDYYFQVKDEVKEETDDLLHTYGLEEYKVKVYHDTGQQKRAQESELSKEENAQHEKYSQQSKELEKAILAELDKQNYQIISAAVRINSIERFIPLEIPITETRVYEMKKIVSEIAEDMGIGEFEIKVYRTDLEKEEAMQRWSPVINTITTSLIGMEDYKVEGVGFSFYPSQLTFSIKTSMDANDPKATEIAKDIVKAVQDFIESEDVKENVKDDPYVIEIYSKDKKRIN